MPNRIASGNGFPDMKPDYSSSFLISLLIFHLLLLAACDPGLHGDVRARESSIAIRNNDPGTWTYVSLELDGEYKLELDSLQKGADTVLPFSLFKNQLGETYAVRGTRPNRIAIYAGQGMMEKRLK